ncbi:hypothetical protein [Agrococcus sp. SCSIO52902]|uniref:hypothetical protein n=1 Tax=Agrococcus sp. SCSIO52902 TaxID=2933290 RepID=UPI001FF1CA74|nr:hypothetical protein [Agrococcus sp. SCSIO52902]UOW00852.1 hypothetical protein MU522_00005 [Agrococcus sp. SCSIO52902]
MSGAVSACVKICVVLRPSPTSRRAPIVSGSVRPKIAMHAAATQPPPDMSPGPRIAGHASNAPSSKEAAAMMPPATSRMRSALVMVRRSSASRRGSSDSAAALISTAAMPRSAKGSSAGRLASSPYCAYASTPNPSRMMRLVTRPTMPVSAMTTTFAAAAEPTWCHRPRVRRAGRARVAPIIAGPRTSSPAQLVSRPPPGGP